MSIRVEELKQWLETLDKDSLVWISKDGLLENIGDGYETYLEVGGENDN